VEAVGLFLTFREFSKSVGAIATFNCVFCEKYFRELPGEVLGKKEMVGAIDRNRPGGSGLPRRSAA